MGLLDVEAIEAGGTAVIGFVADDSAEANGIGAVEACYGRGLWCRRVVTPPGGEYEHGSNRHQGERSRARTNSERNGGEKASGGQRGRRICAGEGGGGDSEEPGDREERRDHFIGL